MFSTTSATSSSTAAHCIVTSNVIKITNDVFFQSCQLMFRGLIHICLSFKTPRRIDLPCKLLYVSRLLNASELLNV